MATNPSRCPGLLSWWGSWRAAVRLSVTNWSMVMPRRAASLARRRANSPPRCTVSITATRVSGQPESTTTGRDPVDNSIDSVPVFGQHPPMALTVREYRAQDEEPWLRLRVVSFLHTAYFDAVERRRPPLPVPGFGLVAEEVGELIGLIDVTVSGGRATIDTIAVHPDQRNRGVATALLTQAAPRATAAGASVIEAWTRDDEPALCWYRARGFQETDHYLHVYANLYANPAEPGRAVRSARPGLQPIALYCHGPIDQVDDLRHEFQRVHVCRRCWSPV